MHQHVVQGANTAGKLYVVATPIGNLNDISQRSKQVLWEADLIVAESVERTLKLLRALSSKSGKPDQQKEEVGLALEDGEAIVPKEFLHGSCGSSDNLGQDDLGHHDLDQHDLGQHDLDQQHQEPKRHEHTDIANVRMTAVGGVTRDSIQCVSSENMLPENMQSASQPSRGSGEHMTADVSDDAENLRGEVSEILRDSKAQRLWGRIVAWHDDNPGRSWRWVQEVWQQGGVVVMVCDAGTPGVADPGITLVDEAWKIGIVPIPVPGPSALTTMMSICGWRVMSWSFLGFLPRRASLCREVLMRACQGNAAVVFFESPRRLMSTFDIMIDILGSDRKVVVARELTKSYEDIQRGSLGMLRGNLSDDIRGEITIAVAPAVMSRMSETSEREASHGSKQSSQPDTDVFHQEPSVETNPRVPSSYSPLNLSHEGKTSEGKASEGKASHLVGEGYVQDGFVEKLLVTLLKYVPVSVAVRDVCALTGRMRSEIYPMALTLKRAQGEPYEAE